MPDQDPADLPSKLTLLTPAQFELSDYSAQLEAVYDAVEVSCLRLSLVTRDEETLCRAADVLRSLSHARDIPVIIDDHYRLVARAGLDGVHLSDGARKVRDVRKLLGPDAIVGAFCGTSRHSGMSAGEAGADYISFGPATAGGLLGDGEPVEPDVFRWWSEMIELPVVAEGGLTDAILGSIAQDCDFLCLGDEIWQDPDGAVAAARRISRLL
ncbi:MAG: thiamine phosphate synthase [Pseudomonadota bacterium]